METEKAEKKASWLISCPNCFAPNNDLAIVCHQCNSKFGANLDPLGIARSEAEMLGKALTIKPSFVVLLGTWMIFLPVAIMGVVTTISQALYDSGSRGFFFFWFGIAGFAIAAYFLYTVTRNYFTMKEKSFNQNDELV